MSGSAPTPHVRRAADVEYEPVELAEGLQKGVLLGEDQRTPNFDMRRFVLEPGARVPRHTNEVEHEQFVEHWYRNDADVQGSFLCVVPKGDDRITIHE